MTPSRARGACAPTRRASYWITRSRIGHRAVRSRDGGRFTPLRPAAAAEGADTPYALNVDRPRSIVWVNGNQSDSLYTFEHRERGVAADPMPASRESFTRDVEFDPMARPTRRSRHFPGWHVEDAAVHAESAWSGLTTLARPDYSPRLSPYTKQHVAGIWPNMPVAGRP